jgi:hypothetical protein
MATILNLEAHRVETAQAAYGPGQTRNLPEPRVILARKSDGAFVELPNETAFTILWERLHGTPEDEMREWVQALVVAPCQEADDWQRAPAETVAG